MSDIKTQSLTLKGDIAAVLPAKLFYSMYKYKKSGILILDDGVTNTRLFFKEGCIFPFLNGIKKGKGFGTYLVRNKKITKEELALGYKLARDNKTDFINELLEKRILDEFDVDVLAKDYYWKSVGGAFAWRHGKFIYQEAPFSSYTEKINPANTFSLIVKGIRESYNPKMIHHRLGNRMNDAVLPFKQAIVSLDQLGLDAQALAFADALTTGSTINEAIDKTEMPQSDALALAFALMTFELAKFKPTGKPKKKWKKKTRIDILMEIAARRVDEIHEQVRNNEIIGEVPQSLKDKFGDLSPEELKRKLAEMVGKENTEKDSREYPDEEEITFADFDQKIEKDLQEADGEGDEEMDDEPSESEDEFRGLFDGLDEKDDDEDEEDLLIGDIPEEGQTDEFGVFETDAEDDLDLSDFSRDTQNFSDPTADAFTGSAGVEFSSMDDPERIYEIGKTYLEQGSYDVAEKAFRMAYERGMDTVEVKCDLSWATYSARENKDGFEHGAAILQEIIEANPKHHLPHLYLGKIYESEGDITMAELYFIKALELNRDCEEAKHRIKRIYDRR